MSRRWIVLAVIFFGAGFLRGEQASEWRNGEQALLLDEETGMADGTVCSLRSSKEQWVLILKDCVFEKKMPLGKGQGDFCKLRKLQVYLDQSPSQGSRPRIGSRIRVKGQLSSFFQARNPGEFDYNLYYCSQGLIYRMFADSWKQTGEGYSRGGELLYRWAEQGGEILDQISSPKDAGIFRAVILGDKSQLDDGTRKMYQKSGIAHLLAISGLHLSLISAAVYGSLRGMGAGYGRAGVVGGLILAGYAGMTGMSPSVMRAWIMVLSGFLAMGLGRTYDLFSALGLAGILLLWNNPYQMFQGGVQLSFGAVAGIGIAAEMMKGEPDQDREKDQIPQKNEIPRKGFEMLKAFGKRFLTALGSGLVMQLVTLPIILYHFFQIPLYGIFLNLLTVPLMGIVVASGVAGIFLGSFSLPLGRFAAGSGHWILKFYENLCRVWECFPWNNLILGRPALWKMWAYGGIAGAAVWMWKNKRRKGSGILFLASLLFMCPVPVCGMETTFLDVGQGDGICIRTGTKTILVDGGSTDQKQLGENRLEPFLKSKGISVIDYAIVSHGDQDHISGLLYLMEESPIHIRYLVLPQAGKGDVIYNKLEELAKAQKGTTLWMKRGDRIRVGRLEIYCHYPQGVPWDQENYIHKTEEDRNEHSLVLQVNYNNFHMLLTGDMSGEGEKRLLSLDWEDKEKRKNVETGLREVQVLKVAHHGSPYSTTRQWVDILQPKWAVISYGEGNRYGHPGREVLETLEESNVCILETAERGAIILTTDGHCLHWQFQTGDNVEKNTAGKIP